MKVKPESLAQKKANSRNQLFRQIHGYNLIPFISRAVANGAITMQEHSLLIKLESILVDLKHNQFNNSKRVGLNPRRRCHYCNNIARWEATVIGNRYYCCNKHKEKLERNNKQNPDGEWMTTNIHQIDPTK